MLFKFINDLTIYLKSFGIGTHIDGEHLLFADYMVILAETASDLQLLLYALNAWCEINDMIADESKSNIVHFRPNSIPMSDGIFTCGNNILQIVDKYKYIGIVLHGNLDNIVTVQA